MLTNKEFLIGVAVGFGVAYFVLPRLMAGKAKGRRAQAQG